MFKKNSVLAGIRMFRFRSNIVELVQYTWLKFSTRVISPYPALQISFLWLHGVLQRVKDLTQPMLLLVACQMAEISPLLKEYISFDFTRRTRQQCLLLWIGMTLWLSFQMVHMQMVCISALLCDPTRKDINLKQFNKTWREVPEWEEDDKTTDVVIEYSPKILTENKKTNH